MSILRTLFSLPERFPTDPIDHPDLQRMTSRELADLPFPRIEWEADTRRLLNDSSADNAGSRNPVRSCPAKHMVRLEAGRACK
jgi:hypothetical protein